MGNRIGDVDFHGFTPFCEKFVQLVIREDPRPIVLLNNVSRWLN
jgi:hypothetical protein